MHEGNLMGRIGEQLLPRTLSAPTVPQPCSCPHCVSERARTTTSAPCPCSRVPWGAVVPPPCALHGAGTVERFTC